uniref:Tick transposon n=2 Tax=Cacopsylla melanoneura TaxID=428564 RepID=A0A8D8QVA8_9HEMI
MDTLDIINNGQFQIPCNEFKRFENSFEFFNNSGINIFHINIQSIQSHFNEFLIYFNKIKKNVQVLVFTETRHSTLDMNRFNIDSFDLIYTTNYINMCAGVVVYIRNDLNYITTEISLTSASCLHIEIQFTPSFITSIVCIYRVQSFSIIQFLNEIEHKIFPLWSSCNNHKHKIIIGDININILPETLQSTSTEYLNSLSEFGFVPCINNPTRVTTESSTCIDHIFYSGDNITNIKSCICQISITDHYGIALNINKNDVTQDNEIKRKEIKIIDYQKLNNTLENENWDDFYNEIDIHKKCKLLTNKLTTNISNCTTVKRIQSKYKPIKPWISIGLVTSIRVRDKLALKVRKHPENNRLKEYYKKYRTTLTKLIKKARTLHYKKEIEKIPTGEPRKLWSILHEITDKRKVKHNIKYININGAKIDCSTNEILVANEFNKRFSRVGTDIALSIQNNSRSTDFIYNNQNNNNNEHS